MTFAAYVRSHGVELAICLVAIALTMGLLAVAQVGVAVIVLVGGVLAVALAAAVALGYGRKRAFYRALAQVSHEVDHPAWVTEVVEEPDFAEGRVVYEAVRAIAKSANDDIAAYRRQVEDYRTYVETWVHEAKTPLAAARLTLENLSTDLAAADGRVCAARAARRVSALEDEVGRMDGFIEQALFYARSETFERDYLIRSYTLDTLVGAALRERAHELIGARIAPRREGLDLTVFTDEKWLVFILGQLIQNSVQYASAGRGAWILFAGALRDAGTAEERVELAVADSGPGVSAADLPRVFDRGFTGEAGRGGVAGPDGAVGLESVAGAGRHATGIALYLVKRLCEKMGVGVRAATGEHPGEGLRITFSFPTNKFHYFDEP